MEDYNQSNESQSSQSTNDKPFREMFKTGSPDEVRERVKDTVAKGVAAVAGALRGFTETTKNEDIANQTKEAISTAGETASSTVSAATETASKTVSDIVEKAESLKEPLKEAGQKLGSTAQDLRSTAKETTQAFKGGGSSGSSSSGSSWSGGSSESSSMSGYAGSSLGSSSLGDGSPSVEDFSSSADMARGGAGTELPDISSTPLAASDKELKGKDLSSESEY